MSKEPEYVELRGTCSISESALMKFLEATGGIPEEQPKLKKPSKLYKTRNRKLAENK